MQKIIIYIVTILSFCFLGKAQSQDIQWTSQEVTKVQQEIELIQVEIPLTETQKGFLKIILLQKNRSLRERVRTNHIKKIILSDIEDVLRYGRPINRHPGEENVHRITEILSVKDFVEKIQNNRDLLRKLDLNQMED